MSEQVNIDQGQAVEAWKVSGGEKLMRLTVLVAFLGLCAVGVRACNEKIDESALQSRIELEQIQAEVAEDGFDIANDRWGQPDIGTIFNRDDIADYFTVTVDIGGCEIPVDGEVTYDQQNNVTEVGNYSFDGYVLAKVVRDSETRNKVTRYYDRYAGEPIEFTFNNLQGLQETLQTEDLCAVLAQSYVSPTTVPR